MSEIDRLEPHLAEVQRERRRALATNDEGAAALNAKRAAALADVAQRAVGRTQEARPYVEEALRSRWSYGQIAGPGPGHGPGRGKDFTPKSFDDGLDPVQRARWRQLYALTESRLDEFLRTCPDLPTFRDMHALAVHAITGLGPEQGDDWFTPAWLFDQLQVNIDLDVCAPADPAQRTVPAEAYYTAEDDGLEQPWHGLVWCNPPYSSPAPWAERWLGHGNGLLLTHIPWNATWVVDVWRRADAIMLFQGLTFGRPNNTMQAPAWAVQIVALGPTASEALGRIEAEKTSPVLVPRR